MEIVGEALVAQRVDLVVVPTSPPLWMGHGIAHEVRDQAGEEVEREAMAQGPGQPGQVVLTGPGRLPCRRIAHAVVAGYDLRPSPQAVRRATQALVQTAETLKLSSMAMPPMVVHPPRVPDEVVSAMLDPLIEQLPEVSSLRLVRLCIPDQSLRARFKAALERYFSAA